MQIRRDFPYPVQMTEDLGIVLPDGTRLSARLWQPVTDEAVPVILEFLPYRKRDGTVARDSLTHPWFAGHGYGCLRVDMRGTGDSEGRLWDEYSEQELSDACDVIAWARAQTWCSGTVGMMGISWGGFNGLQVAARRPEGLRAVVSLCSTVDRFADDIHWKGGCQLTENLGWASQMLAYSSRPPDPEVVGPNWREMWLGRLKDQPFLLSDWLAHQRRDAYWAHGSVCEDYDAIEAAVLSIGGWHDGYRNTPAHLAAHLKAPVKAIVGPWNHKYPHFAAPGPAIGFLQEAKRWWDRWLKGIETGVEADPAMRLWLMDAQPPKPWYDHRPGRWIAEATWPTAKIRSAIYHLTDAGLSDSPGHVARQIASPADCGAAAGEYFPFAFGDELPVDQREDDARSVCFDTAPLAGSVDIVGAPEVALSLTSDVPQAQIAVRLCDVAPDGASALISHGFLNLSHRRSPANPEPLTPGQSETVTVRLDQIAYRIPSGHRLRVALSNAYWPFLWPAPGKAVLTLTHGRLSLPERPHADGDEWVFEAPEGAPPWNAAPVRPSAYERHRETDPDTGMVRTRIVIDNGANEDLDHGLITGSRSEEVWEIHPDDPLSASGRIAWEEVLERGAWKVRTTCRSEMRCDATHWHIHAEIRAYEDGTQVFAKTFDDSILRDQM